MQRIKQLLQGISPTERGKEFQALQILDDNIQELHNRILNIEKVNQKYYCTAERVAAQAVGIGAVLSIPFDSTVYPQYGNMHDNVNNNDKIYIRRNGVYYLNGYVSVARVADDPAGYIQLNLSLSRNGAIFKVWGQRANLAIGDSAVISVSGIMYCYRDDFITLSVVNGTAVIINLYVTDPAHYPRLSVSERMEELDPSSYGVEPPKEL